MRLRVQHSCAQVPRTHGAVMGREGPCPTLHGNTGLRKAGGWRPHVSWRKEGDASLVGLLNKFDSGRFSRELFHSG